jgi:DNA-binding response OmpR family regulator
MPGPTDPGATALAGALILAVEDDFLVLLEIATVLRDAGAVVISCTTVEQALRAIDAQLPAAAVLDVRIGRDTIAPVARRLAELDTPFIFYTGQVTAEPPMAQWPHARMVPKPAPAAVLVKAVAELLAFAQPRAHDR